MTETAPDPAARAALDAMMQGLRERYLAHLRERRPEIAEFAGICAKQEPSAQDRERVLWHVHKLAGSGKTYGYEDITRTAAELEYALQEKAAALVLAPQIQALLAALNIALTVSGDVAWMFAPATSPEPQAEGAARALLLTADDDDYVRDIITRLFAPEMDVIQAENGQQALLMMERRTPDIVILDDIMPHMTGMKLLETLAATPEFPCPPIIMLTSSNREADRSKALSLGVADFVTKPFAPVMLRARVRELARTHGATP